MLISKAQRITNIADFISARYGKNTSLGVIVTLMSVIGVIPYISLQLKAISSSFILLTHGTPLHNAPNQIHWTQSSISFAVAIALAFFTILFGTRTVEPGERHEGIVMAVVFESLVKLIVFLVLGCYICYNLYDGVGDIFTQAWNNPETRQLFFQSTTINGLDWIWLMILSMCAIILLPRQFHIGVVENISALHIRKATWLFPLYLLLINLFVIPVAIAGNIRCITNPGETVHGYFRVSAVSQKRLFIREEFLGQPTFYSYCATDTIYDSLPEEGLNKTYWVIEDNANEVPAWWVVTEYRECADCTTEGTKVKPPFWDDDLKQK